MVSVFLREIHNAIIKHPCDFFVDLSKLLAKNTTILEIGILDVLQGVKNIEALLVLLLDCKD